MNWDGIKNILNSRKFALVVLFGIVAALHKQIGIDAETITKLLWAVVAAVGAEGAKDVVQAVKGTPVPKEPES